jgi:hypothetical protein
MKDISLPKVIFGTSGLGNLYVALSDEVNALLLQKASDVRLNRLYLTRPVNTAPGLRWNRWENL